MSTNISRQKREDLLDKIKEIRAYIAAAPQDGQTARLLVSLSQLEREVNGKKYGLVYEEHREEIDRILEEHVPVLTEEPDLFIRNGGQMHVLMEGDNLAALKLLEKTHLGKVDLIYIDPPYNRGKRDFIYDDDYIEPEDAFRHSKWISFMRPRLVIARRLMQKHGCIFISCDDNEVAALRLLCDEIFGEQNFQGHIHWRRRHNQPNDKTKLIALVTEHILVYSKNREEHKKYGVGKVRVTGKFTNPDNDPRGPWASKPWKSGSNQSGCTYTITSPTGKVFHEEWLGDEDTFRALEKDHRIVFPRGGNGSPRKKYFQFEREEEGQCATNWWPSDLFGCNQDATDELKALFDGVCPFDNPKPTRLIKSLINLGYVGDSGVILDFFAGSGTTGEAVMQLNAAGAHHRFILCTNNENNICRDVTYERIKRAIDRQGYQESLKYYKIDYVPVSGRLYYEYADELLRHMRELIELETGVHYEEEGGAAIALTEEELEEWIEDTESFRQCKRLYMGMDLLPSEEQETEIAQNGTEIQIIPDYYYQDLQEGSCAGQRSERNEYEEWN